MTQVWIKGPGDIRVTGDAPVPDAREGMAVVRSLSNGICGSDMHRYEGKMDILHLDWITGHEMGGVIHSINAPGSTLRVGQKVAVNPVFGCGNCDYCRDGRKDLCLAMDFYGTMGEYVELPVENLIPLPSGFDMRYAGMIEPAAVAVSAAEGIERKTVLIIGTGSIGLLQQQVLTGAGCRLITCDLSNYSVVMSRKTGADRAFRLSGADADRQEIRDFAGENGVDVVMDNVCIDATLALALDAVRRGGEVRMVGVNFGRLSFRFVDALFPQINLSPRHIYTDRHYHRTVELIETGVFDFAPLVTRFFPLEEAAEAFRYKREQPSTKVLLLSGGEVEAP